MEMSEAAYVGQELHIFARAVNWKRYFAAKLRPYLGRRVVEVGAGLGATTAILCDGTQDLWTCLEPDSRLVAQIETMIAAGRLPACCRAVAGVISDLDPDQAFDSIVYVDVLEHIQADGAELEQAARRLLPGGALIVLSPAFNWLFSPFDRSIGHYRRYDKGSLRAITPMGCVVEKLLYLDSLGVITSIFNRLVLRQDLPTDAQIQLWDRWIIPVSRLVDPVTSYSFGRSIAGVWRRVE